MIRQNNRWYDTYPNLSLYLENLKDCQKDKKDNILLKIKELIIANEPRLIDKNVMKFPMNQKRRWYDKDPYSWLIINSLKFAELDLINKVIDLLKKELQ